MARVFAAVAFALAMTGCSILADDDTSASGPSSSSSPSSHAGTASGDGSQLDEPTSDLDPVQTVGTFPPGTFSNLFETVSTGIHRLAGRDCEGRPTTGSGFLVANGRLLTAAHLVTGTTSAETAHDAAGTETATVIATDLSRDLALLEVANASGHVFELNDSTVAVGDDVASLDHPRGLDLAFTVGRLSELMVVHDGVMTHRTDAPVLRGGSGGPLVDRTGAVVGMTDWRISTERGVSTVVAASELRAFLETGNGADNRIDVSPTCDREADGFEPVDEGTSLADIALVFEQYALLINTAKEGEAYDLYAGPRLRQTTSRQQFVDGNSTSILEDIRVYNVFWTTEGEAAEAWVTFVSYQDSQFGTNGQTCSVWDLTYSIVLEEERWKIDRAVNEPGSPASCS